MAWNHPEQTAREIVVKGAPLVNSPSTVKSPASEHLHKARDFMAGLLKDALDQKTRIVFFGDFDVDGTTSLVVNYLFSKILGIDALAISSRRNDEYGLSPMSVERILKEAPAVPEGGDLTLVVMDLGVNSFKEARGFLEKGWRFMAIDHHEPSVDADPSKDSFTQWMKLEADYPSRVMCYDPILYQKADERETKLRRPSAAGLCFRIIEEILEANSQGLNTKAIDPKRTRLSIRGTETTRAAVWGTIRKAAAMAQPADVCEMAFNGETSEAWRIAKLWEKPEMMGAGMRLLWERTHTATLIGWRVGPVINAAGRMDDAFDAFSVMTEFDDAIAAERMKLLDQTRTGVQEKTRMASEGLEQALLTDQGVAILFDEQNQIPAGVVGIAAARAAEKFRAPALYMAFKEGPEGGYYKGSMRRGPTDFSCEKWVQGLKNSGVAKSGGGHAAAAGVTVGADALERLLASAKGQRYSQIPIRINVVGVSEALIYARKLAEVMPLGKGNESARLEIRGILGGIRELRKKDPPGDIFGYAVSLVDPGSGETAVVDIMLSDLTPWQASLIADLAVPGCTPRVGFAIRAEVIDNFKNFVKWDRWKFRAHGHKWETPTDELIASEGLSPNDGFVSFFTVDDVPAAGGMSQEEIASSLHEKEEQESQNVSEDGPKPPRLTFGIDHDEECPPNIFILRKPRKTDIAEILGEVGAENVKKLHGGRWSQEKKYYEITFAVVEWLRESGNIKGEDYEFTLSPRAEKYYRTTKAEIAARLDLKNNQESYEVPLLRKEIEPKNYQFADVRLYYSIEPKAGTCKSSVAICNNDMGTGKTCEAAMWAAMRHLGYKIGHTGPAVPPETPRKKPILFVTLTSVMGQYAKEIEKFLECSPISFLTEQLSSFVKENGAILSQEPSGMKSVLKVKDELVKKVQGLAEASGFVVSSFDCLARHPWFVKAIEWGGVVIDEAHELKEPGTWKTKALFGENCDGAPLKGAPVLAMSGTFAKNRPSDWYVWVRLTGADSGIYTGGRVNQLTFDFRFNGLAWEEKRIRGGMTKKIPVPGTPENGEELKIMLAPFTVRRLKAEVEGLPDIEVKITRQRSSGLYSSVVAMLNGYKKLPEHHEQILRKYDIIDSSGQLKAEDAEDDKLVPQKKDEAFDPASLGGKLSMISSLDKGIGIMDTLKMLGWVDEQGKPDEPFVVITMHKAASREIVSRLAEAGIETIFMSAADGVEKRQQKSSAFQKGEGMAFVTTFGVGGTGLNLTRAHRILLMSIPYIESQLQQARDRVHRIGQKHNVEAVILIQSASIDEIIWKLVTEKGKANFKTLAMDVMRKGELPGWATGSIVEQAASSGAAKGKIVKTSSGEGKAAAEQPVQEMSTFRRAKSMTMGSIKKTS